MSFLDDFWPKPAQDGAHSKRLALAFLGACLTMGCLGGSVWMADPLEQGLMFALPFLLISLVSLGHGIYHLNEFHVRFESQDTHKTTVMARKPAKRKNNRNKKRR